MEKLNTEALAAEMFKISCTFISLAEELKAREEDPTASFMAGVSAGLRIAGYPDGEIMEATHLTIQKMEDLLKTDPG